VKIAIIVIVSVLGTAGLLVGVGMAFRGNALAGKQEVTAVRVEPAAAGALVELVSVPGEIQPEEKVQISSRVPAQILDLPHKEGERVTRYDLPGGVGASATGIGAAPVTRPADTQPAAPDEPAAPATQPVEPPASSVLVRLDARDLKASLDSAEARAKAQEAEIEVAKARVEGQRATILATGATLTDAERELRRQEELFKTKDVAEQAVDQAHTKVDELRNQMLAAHHNLVAEEKNLTVLGHNLVASRADIDKAREQLSYTTIASPINGTIIKVNSKVGESVVPGIQGSLGSVILEVADLSRMLMIGRVDEASVDHVKVGQRATVRMQAYRDKVFEGTVQSVALAKADERSAGASQARQAEGANYYEVRILLKTDGQRIFCGLTADADIETDRHEGIKVPSQAVLGRPVEALPQELRDRPEIEKGKQYASVVYRYIDGKAVVTPVKVGPSDETHTMILSGLRTGEPVITGPYKILDQLQNDQKVNPESNPPTTQPAAGTTQPPAATQPTTMP